MTYEKPLPAPSAGGLCFQIGTLGTLTAESGSHSVHSGNMENTAIYGGQVMVGGLHGPYLVTPGGKCFLRIAFYAHVNEHRQVVFMGRNAAGTETETNPPSVILSLMTYEKPLPIWQTTSLAP